MTKERPSESLESLAGTHRVETRVQGSRFIGFASPVSTPAEAAGQIDARRREFPDATHHCFAFHIAGEPHDHQRAQDAGEPAGTAGRPILQAIRAAGLTNVLVVVTRYFGGTKLGKGGLARAYRDAARGALDGAARVRVIRRSLLALQGPLERDGEVRHLVARHGGTMLEATYSRPGEVGLVVNLPSAAAGRFDDELRALTRGTWRVRKADRSPSGGEAEVDEH